tara:strand:- start:4392 stop:6914 length:2523 start_codon:yes stop_codon:yes gene_type:complete
MSRLKYGIDLGTTNSGLSRIVKGESKIVKNSSQQDTTPSCIGFTRKGGVQVGTKAFNQLKSDKIRALKSGTNSASNIFLEFKRTMGTDQKYHSDNMNLDYSSPQLSAEILKSLKSLVEDNFKSVVITIPAMFNDNQKSATIESAKLAGFDQVELLQEPIAAATAFGVDEQVKNGNILVFDFGGGTFDVCLISIEEGIMQVKDTGGDNWLGGKNLDEAIVDKIILPWLKENYKIESFLNDENKKAQLNDVLKLYAEELKVSMSFSDEEDIVSDLGELPEDDDGEEMEIEISVNSELMNSVLSPVFQVAIDHTIELLKNNNLKGSDLTSLLLVGGPTFSPILRKMVSDQICKPNTKVDPMTVVARGAAIYATKFDVDEVIKDEVRDETKIQLDLTYESQGVELDHILAIKVNKEKTKGEIPSSLFVTIKRGDGAWESEKISLDDIGEIVDLQLRESKANNFEILITNEKGDTLEVEPADFTVMHGVKTGKATLAYNYGIEMQNSEGKPVFITVPGLEKNQTLPANGEITGLTTKRDLRPGTDDAILIPVYQAQDGADNTRASSHIHVRTCILHSNDLPAFLPTNSDVTIFLDIEKEGDYKLTIDIPFLNETIEKTFEKKEQEGEADEWFDEQFQSIVKEIDAIKKADDQYDIESLNKIELEVNNIQSDFNKRKSDGDTRMKTRDAIRKQFAELDKLTNNTAWPSAESEMKKMYYTIEEKVKSSKDSSLQNQLNRFNSQMKIIIENEDVNSAKELKIQMNNFYVELLDAEHGVDLYIGVLVNFNDDFDSHPWNDRSKARSVLDAGMKEAMSNPSKDRIVGYCQQLWQLLPRPGGKKARTDILG